MRAGCVPDHRNPALAGQYGAGRSRPGTGSRAARADRRAGRRLPRRRRDGVRVDAPSGGRPDSDPGRGIGTGGQQRRRRGAGSPRRGAGARPGPRRARAGDVRAGLLARHRRDQRRVADVYRGAAAGASGGGTLAGGMPAARLGRAVRLDRRGGTAVRAGRGVARRRGRAPGTAGHRDGRPLPGTGRGGAPAAAPAYRTPPGAVDRHVASSPAGGWRRPGGGHPGGRLGLRIGRSPGAALYARAGPHWHRCPPGSARQSRRGHRDRPHRARGARRRGNPGR